MGNISVALPSDGSTASVAQYNTPITTIVNEFNGNIDNSNVKASAAIATSKLADDAGITDAKISGVSSRKLANPYKFSVYRNAALTIASGAQKIPFDTKNYDTGTNVDIATNIGRFTAPVAGFYKFNAGASAGTAVAGNGYQILLYVNGAVAVLGNGLVSSASSSFAQGLIVSQELQLAATDYVEVYFQSAGQAMSVGKPYCYFSGSLVSAT